MDEVNTWNLVNVLPNEDRNYFKKFFLNRFEKEIGGRETEKKRNRDGER